MNHHQALIFTTVYRRAYKSLARPGEKGGKITTFKLGHPVFDGGI
jgi:hypothetical protein